MRRTAYICQVARYYVGVKSITLWVALLLLIALPLSAATLTGRVVSVHDGDTITVLEADRVQHKIRLQGIDAPELGQAFGSRSKQYLSSLVYNHHVTVEWNKFDRYRRVLGVVFVDGHDANLEQVRAGMAWWYRHYAGDQRPAERRAYETAEDKAREAKRGLWDDPHPMPPWEWRRQKRKQ